MVSSLSVLGCLIVAEDKIMHRKMKNRFLGKDAFTIELFDVIMTGIMLIRLLYRILLVLFYSDFKNYLPKDYLSKRNYLLDVFVVISSLVTCVISHKRLKTEITKKCIWGNLAPFGFAISFLIKCIIVGPVLYLLLPIR